MSLKYEQPKVKWHDHTDFDAIKNTRLFKSTDDILEGVSFAIKQMFGAIDSNDFDGLSYCFTENALKQVTNLAEDLKGTLPRQATISFVRSIEQDSQVQAIRIRITLELLDSIGFAKTLNQFWDLSGDTSQLSTIRFCANCNKRFVSGYYCPDCGAELQEGPKPLVAVMRIHSY